MGTLGSCYHNDTFWTFLFASVCPHKRSPPGLGLEFLPTQLASSSVNPKKPYGRVKKERSKKAFTGEEERKVSNAGRWHVCVATGPLCLAVFMHKQWLHLTALCTKLKSAHGATVRKIWWEVGLKELSSNTELQHQHWLAVFIYLFCWISCL